MLRRTLMAALAVCGPACASDSAKEALPTPGDRAAAFHRLLMTAKANPASTDWPALRAAYAASPTYDPYAGTTPEAAAAEAALLRMDFHLAATLADQALRRNWMNVRAQSVAAVADKELGNAGPAAVHQEAEAGSLRAIMATGDGASPTTAFHVLAASEEYLVLQSRQLHPHGQKLLQVAGHWYDVLTVARTPGGPRTELYFNVDTPLAREASLMAGANTLVADDQLP